MTSKSPRTGLDLSVIITAYAEGILLHKTLASVRRALEPLHRRHITTEILLHCDNPSDATSAYLLAHRHQLQDVRLFTNHFGDLGSSRNFAVGKARGTFVTFIDADDLMSDNWLDRALHFLQQQPLGEYVAHSERTVEFGAYNAVVIKHGELSRDQDALLSVFANRWNSIIMAPRQLLLSEPYAANSPGFGYEDWQLNCRFINLGVHNVLIPKTAIFVRRKTHTSEWLRQQQTRAVLRQNPLFTFSNVRAMENAFAPAPDNIKATSVRNAKKLVKKLVGKVPGGVRLGRKALAVGRQLHATRRGPNTLAPPLPAWLITEWQAMHQLERQIFLSEGFRAHPTMYDSFTLEQRQAANAFKQLIDHTRYDHYDYIMFVPWLVHGGADLFAIGYANEIQAQRPNARIMLIATMPTESPRRGELLETIDFLPFGLTTQGLAREVQYRVLEQLIENSGAQHLHIINSELAYDFISDHATYIQATNKSVVATSFSQSVDGSGRVFGYSHTHVPAIYDLVTRVTTDNQAVAQMWIDEYGFDPAKIIVQHQPVALPEVTIKEPGVAGHLRVLWASRFSPEKQPAIVAEIGRLLNNEPITIDMYGTIDPDFDTSFLKHLPPNVRYCGSFNGPATLPLNRYDAYLYTSLFDGMPNVVLEIAAAKLPIVSSAVGGVPDFITDSVSGLLVHRTQEAADYVKALRTMLRHPEAATTYADKLSQKLRREFSYTAYQKQIAAYLTTIGL